MMPELQQPNRPGRAVLYLGVTTLLLAFLLGVILVNPAKGHALAQFVGLSDGKSYFQLARQMRYGAADWRQRQRVAQSPQPPVYLLGDSLTEGLDMAPLGAAVLNVGVSGERVAWLAGDIHERGYLDDADCVLITIGINDLAFASGNRIKPAYTAVLDHLAGVETLLVGTVLPTTASFSDQHPGTAPARIAAFNTWLAEACTARANCRPLVWAGFADDAGHAEPALYLADGLHLGPAGYQHWRTQITVALEEAACL